MHLPLLCIEKRCDYLLLAKQTLKQDKILNIMSADANNSQERAILMLLPVIVGPFHIAICLWLIAMTIGWAMAFAFVFLLVVTPININTFKNVAKWIREATKRADKRVKLVNELISGIRIIKFYAWEKPFLKMIEKARAYEMDAIARHAYWVQIGMMAAFPKHAAVATVVCVCGILLSREENLKHQLYLLRYNCLMC